MTVASDTDNYRYTGSENLEAMQAAARYNKSLLDLVRTRCTKRQRIVDFGAGLGDFAKALRLEGYSVTCVEPDPDQARTIREAGLDVVHRLDQLPAASADCVYSFNVLEHIPDDLQSLQEMRAALKPGGLLIIYVPAFPLLYSSMDCNVGHVRRYRKRDLHAKVSAAGFEVASARYADSLGFLAALAFKLIDRGSGTITARSVRFYDRWLFPISHLLDRLAHRAVGKNLSLVARTPAKRPERKCG